MHIDFILNPFCIWSYIAFRQLQQVIQEMPNITVNISYFFITFSDKIFPNVNFTPAIRTDFLKEKLTPFLENTKINVKFGQLPPLTQDDKDLIFVLSLAQKSNNVTKVLEDVFYSFFTQGQDITTQETLSEICNRHSLFIDFSNTLNESSLLNLPKNDYLKTTPCMIFNQQNIIFGAQNKECLKSLLYLSENQKFENQ